MFVVIFPMPRLVGVWGSRTDEGRKIKIGTLEEVLAHLDERYPATLITFKSDILAYNGITR